MHVEDRHGVDELRRAARSQKDGRMRIRLQALVLAKQGHTAEEIAAALDASRRPVQEWVRRYNQSGVEGLRRRPGQGRREKLSLEERDQLCARMEALPRVEDEVCTLRGKIFNASCKRNSASCITSTACMPCSIVWAIAV